MTITVIHEVRWLPNDIEAKLSNLLTAIQTVDGKVDALVVAINEDHKTKIEQLASEVKSVRQKLQTSVDNQPKGE